MIRKLHKAVLSVASLDTRFLPATKATAKEMLPVVDKPLIQHAIEEARAPGIDQFCMVTGRRKTALVEHFDMALERVLHNRDETEAPQFAFALKGSDLADGVRAFLKNYV